MRILAVIFIIANLLIIEPIISSDKVTASSHDYTWTYNRTNIYDNQILIYYFTNLDPLVEYTFSVQTLSESGVPLEIIYSKQFLEGNEGCSPTCAFVSIFLNPDYVTCTDCAPAQAYRFGSFRIVDQFGQVLGTHFVAPTPPASWFDDAFFTQEERQTTGRIVRTENVDTLTAADPTMTQTVHKNGSDYYTLLHYQVDATAWVISPPDPTTIQEYIRFYEMDGTLVGDIHIGELIAYDMESRNPFFAPGGSYSSFIPLNTRGNGLPFTNRIQANNAFAGTYINPFTLDLPVAAYEYFRVTNDPDPATSYMSAGENLLFVSSRQSGAPYTIQLTKTDVRTASDLVLNYFEYDCSIVLGIPDSFLQDYHQSETLEDEVKTTCTNRNFTWTAPIAEVTNAEVIAQRFPTNSIILSDGYDVTFDFTIWVTYQNAFYTTNEVVTHTGGNGIGGFTQFLRDTDMDSEIGVSIMFILGIILLFAAIGGLSIYISKPVPPYIYFLTYLTLGGMIIGFGFSTPLFYLLFFVGTLAGFAFLLLGGRESQQNG